jgi:predicted esterase
MGEPLTALYATHPTRKGTRELLADLWLTAGPPADLLVWMHSGGFRTGSRAHRNHAAIAAEFARHGLASAFIDYRLARPPAILTPRAEAALPALLADAAAAGEEMADSFLGPRALAVVEDACAFLREADARRTEWNLSGRYILGGSSAGAISALNALWLPKALGVDRPPVATVFAFSGGFGYPSFRVRTGARILALHSPADARVPVSSVRRIAAAWRDGDDPFRLIEDDAHAHGELALNPRETLREAVARCVAFHRAADPMALPLGAGEPAGA